MTLDIGKHADIIDAIKIDTSEINNKETDTEPDPEEHLLTPELDHLETEVEAWETVGDASLETDVEVDALVTATNQEENIHQGANANI